MKLGLTVGRQVGWLADEILVRLEIFKNLLYIEILDFPLCLTLSLSEPPHGGLV